MTTQEPGLSTHLYLARHGETPYNRERRVQGRGMDIPLNDAGRRQARALADRASKLQLDVIYSSTLLRARETAQIVSDRCDQLPLISLSDLEEMSWGIYEGHGRSPELQKAFKHMVAQWQAGRYDYAVEKGESVLEVQARAERAVRFMLGEHAGKRIMVVAHGRFLRILIATLLEEYGLSRMEELAHSNAGLYHLIHENEAFRAVFLNDTSHLESISA